jgi:hypothetical protein
MALVEEPSHVPLSTKLGVTEGSTMALLHAPRDFAWTPPAGVRITRRARSHADVVLAFFTKRSMLEREIDALSRLVFPAGSLWVAWPKRVSGVATDLTDHVARDVALPLGLVDNKVCAVDQTWTGLRFVWRRSRR